MHHRPLAKLLQDPATQREPPRPDGANISRVPQQKVVMMKLVRKVKITLNRVASSLIVLHIAVKRGGWRLRL